MDVTEWDITNGRYKYFDDKILTMVSHIWQYFIFSILMSTTYYNIIDRERAILLLEITSTKIKDVGPMINKRIRLSTYNQVISSYA